jgi:hypothetical protein
MELSGQSLGDSVHSLLIGPSFLGDRRNESARRNDIGDSGVTVFTIAA